MKSTFSLVITTRNRERLLLQCIGSIMGQSVLPQELIIIDNASLDATKARILSITQYTKRKILYVNEPGFGYPTIYNRGLREAKAKWVAFIDDDCVVDEGWGEAALSAINKYPTAAALVGQSGTVYNNNVWSCLQLINDGIWKGLGRVGTRIVDFETLDNKNIIYNKEFLQTHHISFDERLNSFFGGSSEDCDVGRNIESHKGTAFYIPAMKVRHHDPTTALTFISKLYATSIAHVPFQIKWQSQLVRPVQAKLLKSVFSSDSKLGQLRKIGQYHNKLYGISMYFFWICWLINSLLYHFFVHPLQNIFRMYYYRRVTNTLNQHE